MARKGENIYKRKDGRWEGRYIKSRSSTGKANYGYVYAKSYREVKAKLISQSSCTSNSVTVDPEISSDQFEQVAMEWFQAICPKVKESTSNKYRNLLSSYILPVFGSKQLRDITHEFIETQCNFFLVSGGLKENGLSSKTVSDILSLIRNVLQSQITQSTCIKRSRESKIEPTVNTRQGLLLPHQKVLAPSVLFQYPMA